MDNIPADAPAPRLCHIVKWPDFEGFGFNLRAGKGGQGHFIGKVDEDSPAEAAGLRTGDRIIEVNGVNIGNENHKQVVQRIKLQPNETKLLVLDDEADEYYTEQDIVVKGTQSNVIYKKTPARRHSSSASQSEESEDEPVVNHKSNGRVSNSSASSDEISSAPSPRLCHVIKWNESDGFGFHLLADKNKLGQYIGKIDPGSAAEAAGLKLGDHIIEVNGVNVTQETHAQVVQRIKSVPNETKLLVIDPNGELYYKERNLTIKSTQGNVRHLKTPSQSSRPLSIHASDSSEERSSPNPQIQDLSSVPQPRLCHIVKWNENQSFGFYMADKKNKRGHTIEKIDPGTPAEGAGLKAGDLIIEVNGANVVNETHKEVVQRISSNRSETKLFVVDSVTEAYYREKNLLLKSTQPNVCYLKTPPNPSRPTSLKLNDSSNELPTKPQNLYANQAPVPRLCHIIKRKPSESFGFHLMADKKKPGQFIGKIDHNSLAEAAGLKVGDRIIEVNGANISRETHKQLVERIKSVPNETKLLVVDPATDAYYKERNIEVHGMMENIQRLYSGLSMNQSAGDSSEEDTPPMRPTGDRSEDYRSHISSSSESTAQNSYSESRNTSPSPVSPSSPIHPLSTGTLTAAAATGLNINMSAAELRARLAARKKYDPKRETMDLRQKHLIIQTM